MSRALWALATTAVGVVWLVTFRVTPLPVDAVAAEPSAARSSPQTATPSTRATGPTVAPRSAPPQSAVPGAVATGDAFTGTLINTRYGPVQVRIIVSATKIVDVQAVALPRDRARSAAISQYSSPILRSETIQAQSAKIDVVSGATYTSVAYARSLETALQQAHLG